MSKLTNFSKRTGSPFQNNTNGDRKYSNGGQVLQQEVTLQKTNYDMQKQKQHELQERVNKKTAEINSHKPADNDGCFTEIQAHGAFQGSKSNYKKCVNDVIKDALNKNSSTNGTTSKSLYGFPSSANDLALEAKSDLESDKNISKEVKEKVIKKLFTLVSMVQHMYESKVRVMSEYEKFKEKYLKDEGRREKEHSEQLYKLNMNFQSEVIQAIQQLRTEFDISRNLSRTLEENSSAFKDNSVVFNTIQDVQNTNTEHYNSNNTNDNELDT